MDDMHAFENLVADEVQVEAGPSRPTDVAAVVRTVAAKSPRWRFSSMFSTTKVLAGAAVIALFGGLLLVGLLRPPAEEVPAPAAAAEPAEPVEFQARWTYGGSVTSPDSEHVTLGNSWNSTSNLGWRPGNGTPGDPRLAGSVQLAGSSTRSGALEIWNGAFRIENDEGAWQQRPMIQSLKLSGESEPMAWTAVFDGEGAYEGLAVVAGITRILGGWDVEGVIVDASVLPEPPTTLDFD